jgi:hypothetical protein
MRVGRHLCEETIALSWLLIQRNHLNESGQDAGTHCILQSNLMISFSFLSFDIFSFSLCHAGAFQPPSPTRNVPLPLLISCCCTTLRKRAFTTNTIRLLSTCLHCVNLCPGIKAGFFKYCKQHERRMRLVIPYARVVRADDKKDTLILVSGFITEWKARGKNTMRLMKLDMQFLDHQHIQYFDLHAELMKIDYSPQSKAALINFKVLLLLERSLLLGCDYESMIGRLPQHLLVQKLQNRQF